MKTKHLLLTLLLALMVPWTALAQQALPYSYGFEDNDLSVDGWELVNSVTSYTTGITTSAAHTGSYGFQFCYDEDEDVCLMSPLLTGTTNGVALTFDYKEASNSWGDEQFYVGYTTDESNTDPTTFTYGSIVTASTNWQMYEITLPANTKRIAVKYVYNDAYYLYLDDFSFTAPPSCIKPSGLAATLTPGDGSVATLDWIAGGTETNWVLEYGTAADFTGATSVNVSNRPTKDLTGLTPETTYYARVKADCGGGDYSEWCVNVCTFTPTDAYTLTVNDGTVTNSYVPYYSYYHDSQQRSEFIIPASSLEDMAWGTITSMKFYPNYEYTTSASTQVYLMEVEATTFSDATFYTEADATVVYNGTLTISSTDGMTINFNGDGFEYSGGNLLVGFYQASGGSGYYNYSTCPFYGVTAEGASVSMYYSTQNQALRNFLPKTSFNYVPGEQPTCFKPSGLTVARITARTADLGWQPGAGETQWQICLNDDETNLILVNENSYTLENLTPDTDYTVKVRAYCSATDQSSWTANVPFTTDVLCPAPTALTVDEIGGFSATASWEGTASNYTLRYGTPTAFIYDFESATPWVEDNFAPCTTYDGDGLTTYSVSDWTPISDYQFVGSMMTFQNGVVSFSNGVSYSHGGDLFGGFVNGIPDNNGNGNNDFLITPSITIEAGDVFEFWATSLLDNWGLERMKVGVYGGDGTISEYFEGSATDYVEVPVGWTKYSYDLSSYAGQSIQLAINCVSNDAYILGIDDIFVGNLDNSDWIETVANATSPYTMSLDPETTYVVGVQSVCGGDNGESSWVYSMFTTTPACLVPANFAVSDITAHTALLTWEANNTTETAWQVCINDDEENLIDVTEATYTMRGLPEQTQYTVKVRTNCGDNGYSEWTEAIAFTTDIACYAPEDLAISDITPISAVANWTSGANTCDLRYAVLPATAKGNYMLPNFPGISGTEELVSATNEVRDAFTKCVNASKAGQFRDDFRGDGWLFYDNGIPYTNIGSSSTTDTRTWAVMYPVSMLEGNTVLSKISIYENSYNDGDITITIMQGGDNAPETTLYTETVTPVMNGFHEITLAEPVTIDPTQNLWIALTETGDYVMTACGVTTPNNTWSYGSSGWYHVSISSGHPIGWMIRAYLETGYDPETLAWVNVPDLTEYEYTLPGLDPDTRYIVQVRSNCVEEGYSVWRGYAFNTLSDCIAPTNLTVGDVTTNTATLSWEGYKDSYEMRYRTAEVATYPALEEGFEGGTMPDGWTQEGDGTWNISAGYGYNSIGTHSGTYNAVINHSDRENETFLISPMMDLSGQSDLNLNFWFINYNWGTNDIDQLYVYYRVDGGEWNELWSNTEDHQEWTASGAIALPNLAANYQIGFKMIDKYGRGVGLDDITVGEYVQIAPAGEWVNVTDPVTSPYTLEGLNHSTAYEVQVRGAGCGDDEWSASASFTTETPATVTQTVTLAAGMNWCSFNVDITLDELKAALVATGNTSITIAGKNTNTRYIGGRWRGNLDFSVERMYKITVVDACELVLEGAPLDPAEHSIIITPGANWIGFPLNTTVTPTNAFAGFAINGDVISSKNSNARYTGGRWRGSCDLVPGQGFIYTSSSTENRILVFPSFKK